MLFYPGCQETESVLRPTPWVHLVKQGLDLRLYFLRLLVGPIASAERLNANLIKILQWPETWLVTFNPNKT